MIERRKRGMVRTGTAALGSVFLAMALVASPVGATPFTGESSGVFYRTAFGVDERGSLAYVEYSIVTSGYSTLTGTEQCNTIIRYSGNPGPSQHCAATDLEFILPSIKTGQVLCQNEDKSSTVVLQPIVSGSYSCVPLECLNPDGSLVLGCPTTTHTNYEIDFGTGIYENSTGSFTVTGTSTFDTSATGSVENDTTGDITLAGGAPSDDVFLDIPVAGSTQSGVGVVTGWSCLGGHLEVEFSEADGTPILTDALPHGAYRPATEGACGDTDNGFSMPMNWGRLGPGEKTLTLYVNGEERVTRNFSVTTFGQEFVTDAGGMCEIADLRDGQNATFVWQQANQGLVLVESLN